MAADVNGALRQALGGLEAEKARLDRQIAAVRQALNAGRSSGSGEVREARPPGKVRPGMSTAARKAASARMKAYWAKRRGGRQKKKTA